MEINQQRKSQKIQTMVYSNILNFSRKNWTSHENQYQISLQLGLNL